MHINERSLSEWQLIDLSNDLVLPWFTHPFLHELLNWKLEDKKVLEYGGGYATAWWVSQCAKVCTIEANMEWLGKIIEEISIRVDSIADRLETHLIVANEGETDPYKRKAYLEAYHNFTIEDYDIVVVDGILRYECIEEAIKPHLLPKTKGKLIVDNWQQDYVFICPAAVELLRPYKGRIYPQPDHSDHEGHPWQTGCWEIENPMPSDFFVTNDYDSHRPMLWAMMQEILSRQLAPTSFTLFFRELGVGQGSTPLLQHWCKQYGFFHCAYETNPEWAGHFSDIELVSDYKTLVADWLRMDILFIDCAPGEERKLLIELYFKESCIERPSILIVHDTEAGAEHVYGMAEALGKFKYRLDLLVPGHPRTTAVSDSYDFAAWKNTVYGDYQFV